MTRLALLLALCALLLLVGMGLGLALGPSKIGIGRVVSTLFGHGDSPASVIVWDIRFPRVAIAMLAGGALGLAGCLLQLATRNPLGDPHLFGMGGGAVIAEALVLTGAIGASPWVHGPIAVAASIAGAGLVTLFALREDLSPTRLALIGVTLSVLAATVATGLMAHARVFTQQSLGLLSGSFANRGWSEVFPPLLFLCLGLLLTLVVATRLQVLALGDSLAQNLGVSSRCARGIATLAAGLLTGAAVSISGVVGFVGLLVPHLARALAGYDARALLLLSVPLGAVVALYADQAARLLFMPSEIPVGMVTAILGAPIMIAVARRAR